DAAAAFDLADDVHDFADAGALAALVDDREIGIDAPGDGAGTDDAADVGRDDDEIAAIVALLDVVDEDRRGEEIVERYVEEALDLPGMEVECEDPVGARGGDHVRHELGRDRRAR